jgi:outer membrane immunogenic protein
MRRLVLASATMAILATPSYAADFARKAPAYAAPAAYGWTGCYAGVNGGGAWGRSNMSTVLFPNSTAANIVAVQNLDSPNLRPDGGTAGGQLGCNYQTGRIVFGVEADFGWFGLSDSITSSAPFPSGPGSFTVSNSVKTDWLFTARPRLGYAWDNWMVYMTGGLAVTKLKYRSSFSDTGGELENASVDTTRLGATVGGGIEAMLGRNWSAKVEYLYAHFESSNAIGVDNTDPTFTHTVPLSAHIVRAGINWHFWTGPGPVSARY